MFREVPRRKLTHSVASETAFRSKLASCGEEISSNSLARLSQQLGPAPLDPVKEASDCPTRWRQVLGKQYQPEGQHPEAQDGKEAKYTSTDQEHARGHTDPA
jgi:hypothetical protein